MKEKGNPSSVIILYSSPQGNVKVEVIYSGEKCLNYDFQDFRMLGFRKVKKSCNHIIQQILILTKE
jgi:hypothetical protein